MSAEPKVVIVGAGPAGLGAAWRLHELGHTNWELFESSSEPGGLASSVVDAQGFTWDIGGHVLFSHYQYFDELVKTALGDQWIEHVREAWVWMRDRWIPYPLQNNIWRLPDEELISCLNGLLAIHKNGATKTAGSFRDWLLASFGDGLCETFMLPYNRKVWAYDPSALDVGWMGERVATVDLSRVLRNLVMRHDDVTWGPNATFRFPVRGGTGAIWHAVCGRLPPPRMHFNRTMSGVDPVNRVVRLENGDEIRYDYLISTIPLDVLLRCLTDRLDLMALSQHFVHSSSHIVGVGLDGQTPSPFETKCWIYFPEGRVPFYRATVFSNYSCNNVACPGAQWSLMAEVSESREKPVDANRVVDEVIAGFVASGFIDPRAVVTRWHRRIEHGYPTPWLGRDRVLQPVDQALRRDGILSRGRFGAWKYEVSNQDHSLMQGVEAVDHLLQGRAERTYHGKTSDKE
jgi:protoporphyrinogen oxidase